MKKLLQLSKMLLVVLGLCMGANAWADNMTTMTGLLGPTDNSNDFATYKSKAVTLAAGESYVYTFINYNKGASGSDLWENWAVEANDGTKYLDFRADGGYWGELPSTASYTGSTNTSISSTATTWLQAYNGVTVNVTVSRSNDGATFTVAHTATTNAVDAIASQTYAGTYTATIDGSANITFYLTNEDSHQIINKVVHTDASNPVTNYELKNIDLSQFDSYYSGSYSNGTATFTNTGNSKVWAKMALSDYFENISGTITNVNMKFKENVGGGGRITIGIYGNDKSSWATNAYQDTEKSVSVWGIVGSNYARRIYYGSNGVVNGVLTYDAEATVEVNMDIINKKFTWIQDGTTRVNNQAFIDSNITLPQYLALYSWSATNTTTLSDMTMEIVYVDASRYTINAVAGGTTIKTFTTGLAAEGNTYSAYLPKAIYYDNQYYLLDDGNNTNLTDYYASYTMGNSGDEVRDINYTLDESVTAFWEGEEMSYVGHSFFNNRTDLTTASSGKAVTPYSGTANGIRTNTTIPQGVYDISIAVNCWGDAETSYSFQYSTDNSTWADIKTVTFASTSNETQVVVNLVLPDDSYLRLMSSGTTPRHSIDYILAKKVTEDAITITDCGYSSYVTTYALDFSGVEGLTAYKATAKDVDKVMLEKVTEVPAETPIIVKGTAGATYNIPVGTCTTELTGNLFQGSTTTGYTVADGETVYALRASTGMMHPVNAGVTIPAKKAYLKLPAEINAKALSFGFIGEEEATAITTATADTLEKAEKLYNAAGQQVNKNYKGMVIDENGNKYIK